MRAVIYARISSAKEKKDDDARGLVTAGVDRQEADCRALARERGHEVVDVFVDNNVSAYSGKRRPAFEEMLEAVRAGGVDVVLVYATDRLFRLVSDLERLVTELGEVQISTVRSGEVALATADGKMFARVQGTISQHSSEKLSERVKRAIEAR
ncbi:MAG TPA: recombinase family protein, partial [Candidatus Nanopelagicales bacterium]